MKDRIVVVLLSDKRSGSTMFQDELCKHPLIQTVAYSPHTYLETHHWLKGAVLLNMPREMFAGGEVYAGYGSRQNARTYLIDCVKGNVPGFILPADDRELVFAGWEALCDRFAQPVFFEKSPQILAQRAALSLLLEWINTTRYKVKIIGLTRNPMSVQYSAYQLFHTDPNQRQYDWMQAQKNLLDIQETLPAGSYMHVNYERIIDHPQDAFARVCEFIGVEPAPEIGERVHADSLMKWKSDPYFNLQLDPEVKRMAMRFGYVEADLENPVKPKSPLSYRIKRAWDRFYKLSQARMKDRIIKPVLLRFGWRSKNG